MIVGVGIDALSITRFKYYAQNVPNFLERAFTPRELALSHNQLAGNFSAKEAFFKACPQEMKANISSIEFLRGSFGEPIAITSDLKGQFLPWLTLHVSITNLMDLVITNVIIESNLT